MLQSRDLRPKFIPVLRAGDFDTSLPTYLGSKFAIDLLWSAFIRSRTSMLKAIPMWHYKSMIALFQIVLRLLIDLIALTALALRQWRATAAEILVLRRQIALYKERGIKPRRIDPVTRISLALLSRFFNWREALVVVRPETIIRWHRAGWKLFWRLKWRPGRPRIPLEIQALIRRVANENPAWGEERIANELILKLGIQVSPRTVSKYLPRRPRGRPRGGLRWSTFLRLHAVGFPTGYPFLP
jgi:putative transposase